MQASPFYIETHVIKKSQHWKIIYRKPNMLFFYFFVKAYGQLENSNSQCSVFVFCLLWQLIIHLPPQSLAV